MASIQHQIIDFDREIHSGLEIARLHLQVREWQVAKENNVFSNILDTQEDLADLETRYLLPGGNFFIAENTQTKEILGFVGIKKEGETRGRIKRMCVLPDYHRQGIGSSLMHRATEWARTHGYTQLVLSTGMRENARPIYESYGFQEVGRIIRNRDYMMEMNFARQHGSQNS